MMVSVKCFLKMFVTVGKLFPSTNSEKTLSTFRRFRTLFQLTRPHWQTVFVWSQVLPEAYHQCTYRISDQSFVDVSPEHHLRLVAPIFQCNSSVDNPLMQLTYIFGQTGDSKFNSVCSDFSHPLPNRFQQTTPEVTEGACPTDEERRLRPISIFPQQQNS